RKRGGGTEEISVDAALVPAPPQALARTITKTRPAPVDDLSLDYAKTRLANALSKYDTLLERIDAARIDLETARASFKNRYLLVKAPQVPSIAIRPNARAVIGGGFAAALILAIFAAIAAELRAARLMEQRRVGRKLNLITTRVPKP